MQSYSEESDLLVFPELALSGYLLQDKLSEDAWSMDELDVLARLSMNVDIAIGVALRDGELFYNAALYFHKGRLLHRHNKLHLPNYGMFEEARYFQAGALMESFMVENSKFCMVVCEDLWHESLRESIVEANPDFIIALVASPARGFSDDGLLIQTQWYEIVENLSKRTGVSLCFVNRVGFEDGLGFWGGSLMLDADAKKLTQLELFREQIESVEINLKG